MKKLAKDAADLGAAAFNWANAHPLLALALAVITGGTIIAPFVLLWFFAMAYDGRG